MKLFKQIAVLGLAVSSVSAFGSGVTIPNTFTNATPAIASQVNGNFAAVEAAVDDNDARLDALEPSITPVVVDCTGTPGALQTALNSVKTGKLYISFSGTCSPVTITRSDVEITGASRATAIIAGATGLTAASLSIKNASNVTLKSLTIKRNDDQFVIVDAWRSGVTFDDVLVDHTTGGLEPQEGLRLLQSKANMIGCDLEQVGVHVGSSLVFEDGNTISGSGADTSALDVTDASSVLVFGGNNVFSSTSDVLDMGEKSSLAFMGEAVGNSLSGNIYLTSASVNFANSVAIVGSTSMTINEGSVVAWEGSDGGPQTAVSFDSISMQDSGVLALEDVDLTITTNFNIDGSTVRGRRSNINAPALFVISKNSVFSIEGVGSPVSLIAANISIYDNAVLDLNEVNVTGHIGASRGGRITTQDVTISNGIDLQMFASFIGNTTTINGGVNLAEGGIAFRVQNTSINGGGILGAGSSFRVSGAGSNISGVFTLNNTLNPDASVGNGATHTGATFTNCANGNVAFDGYTLGVCGNDDADGFINYLDLCPAVAGPNNGCP